MVRMAVRGLFARKLRSALTGFAVVIGVAFVDENRERIGGNGPPSIAFSASEERFDPLTYVDGGPAREAGQVAIDEATADREGFEVGDSILVGAREEAREYEITGITNIGDQRSIGIQTLSMPLAEVQRIAQQPGAVTEVVAAADGGTSPEELKASIVSVLGDTADVRTGEEQADESAADINDSFGFIKIALLVFAGIAV